MNRIMGSWDVKIVAGSLLLAMLAMAGCKGGSDKDDEGKDVRRYRVTGDYFRVSYYTDKMQSLYLDAYISSQARHSGTNLARWEKQGMNLPMQIGTLRKVKVPGGTGYITAGTPYGATDPDADMFFLIERSPGLTFYTRQASRSDPVEAADLEGTYSCVRHLNQPSDELQWFQAEFFPGSESFHYSLEDGESVEASYELKETGRFRILEEKRDKQTWSPVPDSEIGTRQERLFAGAFQKQQKFLMVSYMIGDKEPGLNESQPGNRDRRPADEVPSRGLLLCLKGDSRLTQADFQGEYWFAQLVLNSGHNVFGYLTADGAGTVQRTECRRSSGTLRKDSSTYDVNTEAYDGSLVLAADKMKGVLSADGQVALLVGTDPTERSINILMKKYRESGCP